MDFDLDLQRYLKETEDNLEDYGLIRRNMNRFGVNRLTVRHFP